MALAHAHVHALTHTHTHTDIWINGTEQRAQKQTHTPTVNYSLTKEARIYNVEKRVSSASGVGESWTTSSKSVKI